MAKKFLNSEIIRDFQKILTYLNKRRKFQIILLTIFSTISASVEVLSISSLIPMIEILSNTEKFMNNEIFSNILKFFSIDSVNNLKLLFVVIFLFFVFLSYLFKIILIWFSTSLSLKISHDIASLVFFKTVSQKYDYHLDKSSSRFLGNMEKSESVHSFIGYFIQLINSFILSISIIFFVLYLSPKLVIFLVFAIYLIYLLVYKLFKNSIEKNSLIYSKKINERYRVIQESYLNLREVIIKSLQKNFLNQFKKVNSAIINAGLKNALIANIPGNIILFFATFVLSIIIYYMSVSEEGLNNNLPLLAALIFAAQKIITQAQFIYSGITKIKTIKYALKDVLEILNLSNNQKIDSNNKNDLINFNQYINIQNGSFKYNNSANYVLKDVNLKIKRNTLNIIIGKSGSGKSTLIDLILGLLKLNNGKIIIDDQELNDNNLANWQKKISYVPQEISLVDGTFIDNITFGKELINENYLEEIDKIIQITSLKEFINNLKDGLNTKIGENGIKISGGQKQRLAISRALFSNNEIIILDEATNAIDEKTEIEIYENIIKESVDKTIIIISHRENLREKFDNVILVDDKKVNII